jgi:hypothetical protein
MGPGHALLGVYRHRSRQGGINKGARFPCRPYIPPPRAFMEVPLARPVSLLKLELWHLRVQRRPVFAAQAARAALAALAAHAALAVLALRPLQQRVWHDRLPMLPFQFLTTFHIVFTVRVAIVRSAGYWRPPVPLAAVCTISVRSAKLQRALSYKCNFAV